MQVSTEVCEQTFSWLSRYCHLARHMSRTSYMFFVFISVIYTTYKKKLKNAKFI